MTWAAIFFALWWTVDDHLAAALNAPGLGHLPWWVVAIVAFALAPMGVCKCKVERDDDDGFDDELDDDEPQTVPFRPRPSGSKAH